jgi:hypothetical protein
VQFKTFDRSRIVVGVETGQWRHRPAVQIAGLEQEYGQQQDE